MNWKKLACCIAASAPYAQAVAVEPFQPSDTEFASLPPFCKVKIESQRESPEYRMWEQNLGKDFVHTHHYCAGLNYLNRYYRARSKNDKKYNLNNAEGNLQYMIAHADSTYSLMPDVYLKLGMVYSLLNQPAQATTHFNKAIELNPRQPQAYGALADFHANIKQTAKALEIVTEGLRYNPDTKSLQRRYTELGGKLPYPKPIEPAPVVEAQAVRQEEPTPPTANAPVPAPVEPITEPKIGSPTNPYCRFCPD